KPETHLLKTDLLNCRITSRANAQLLSLVNSDLLAAFAEHACRPHPGADGRAHRGANSAAGDSSDNCADAGGPANFFDVAFSRASALHAAFRIDLADTLAAARGKNFNHLRAHL